MKTKFYLLLLCAASFVFFGCENQKNDLQDQGTGISCTPSAIDAPLSGGTYTITVTSTSAWSTSCNRSWVTLDSKSGQGDAYVQLTIAKGEKDSANVIFSTGAGTAIVKIGRGVKASQDDDKPSNGDYGKAPANAIAVDLGLSVKWANMNVGATKPEEYGNYYAWGEVTPKDYYDWSTYKYCNGSDDSMTKYCTQSDDGTVIDNKTVLEKSDDAASYNWGGDWRMPTLEEINELRTKCSWQWTTDYNGTGIKGRIVTGPNGNSIFLPAAGYRYESGLYSAGSSGNYWSSSLYENYSGDAYYLYFDSDIYGWYFYVRYGGLSVRPVLK